MKDDLRLHFSPDYHPHYRLGLSATYMTHWIIGNMTVLPISLRAISSGKVSCAPCPWCYLDPFGVIYHRIFPSTEPNGPSPAVENRQVHWRQLVIDYENKYDIVTPLMHCLLPEADGWISKSELHLLPQSRQFWFSLEHLTHSLRHQAFLHHWAEHLHGKQNKNQSEILALI